MVVIFFRICVSYRVENVILSILQYRRSFSEIFLRWEYAEYVSLSERVLI